MADLPDYERDFKVAVGRFWGVRDDQIERQLAAGTQDAGTRGAVTGGQHLQPIEDLITRVLLDAGVPERAIMRGRQPGTRLPGWFRELKNWDVVVMDGQQIVLTIECKSQVGSFGNNLNNRIEEALGQTFDYWKAAEEVFPGVRPWFGYVMIVEDSPRSSAPVRTQGHVVAPDSEFAGASYLRRYAIAFERMYSERLLDAVVFAQSEAGEANADYPNPALSFQHFAVAIHNRIREYEAAVPNPWGVGQTSLAAEDRKSWGS